MADTPRFRKQKGGKESKALRPPATEQNEPEKKSKPLVSKRFQVVPKLRF